MEIENLFKLYRNKRILITGHTGFKGSWLTIWLSSLGADLYGIGLEPRTSRDNFVVSNVSGLITDIRQDIRKLDVVLSVFGEVKPDIIFHLAAQPLVLESYANPIETFGTNIMGTANILEAIRQSDKPQTAVMVTTDKVYENREWIWPYREFDRLGGYDPYSASKSASEQVIASYRNAFFNPNGKSNKSIASVRAGNVIGGGDWAENRLIPDCVRALERNIPVEIRNPHATRPWQHVLEPLGGYLLLAAKMMQEPHSYAEAWNFGPDSESIITVESLVRSFINTYGKGKWHCPEKKHKPHEAKYLALDITKARQRLQWNPLLTIEQTISFTAEWYKEAEHNHYGNMLTFCQRQIEEYMQLWK